jgi:hypothetical protein
MTVKELKEKLANIPDDMSVMICKEDTNIGGFFFEPACEHDCGVTDLGAPDESKGETGNGGKVFMMSVCQCEAETAGNEN